MLAAIQTNKAAVSDPENKGWLAECHLGFKYKGNKTVLSEKRTRGPLQVQRPFYPEDNVCHVYLLHPPGGVVGGDVLKTNIEIRERANALITTPGASKLYRSPLQASRQITCLDIADGSLEWFPQECIVFNGADSSSHTRIDLHENATFIGWEILCLGRPAASEIFKQGNIHFRLELFRNEKPMVLDQLRLAGNDSLLSAAWGLQSFTCCATFIASGVTRSLFESVLKHFSKPVNAEAGMTLIDDIFVCRYLGSQAEYAKSFFIQIWSFIREELIAKPASEPRIWKT